MAPGNTELIRPIYDDWRRGKVLLEIFAGRERALAAVALTAEDELVGESGAGRRRGVGDD